jgi:hypothetical protein
MPAGMFKKIRKDWNLNGKHNLLVCADDENVRCERINTTKKNTEALLETRKEVGPKVNTEKTKYMVVSRHQNERQGHNLITVWSLTLREERKLRVFENRVLGRNLSLSARKWQEAGEDCIMRSFITYKLRQILIG